MKNMIDHFYQTLKSLLCVIFVYLLVLKWHGKDIEEIEVETLVSILENVLNTLLGVKSFTPYMLFLIVNEWILSEVMMVF